MKQLHTHQVNTSLEEHILYPDHTRTESPEYRKAHHYLVHELDTPCYICGVKHSEGFQIETHHLIEYALQQAIDLDKYKADRPIFVDTNKMDINSVDSVGNMICLCRFCHRGTEKSINHPENIHHTVGIHHATYPIWIAQKYLIEGYKLFASEG